MKNIFKLLSVFTIVAMAMTSCDNGVLNKDDYDYTPNKENLPNSDSVRIFDLSTNNVDVFINAGVEFDSTLIDWGVIAYTSDSAKAAGDVFIGSATTADSLIYDDFEVAISGLSNGQKYYFQAYALNKDGISYSEAVDSSFVLGKWTAYSQKVSYTDDLIGSLYGESPVTYDVALEAFRIEGVATGEYRIVNPYGEDFPYNEEGDWDDTQDYYLTVTVYAADQVEVAPGPLGVDWGYGIMGIYGTFAYGSFVDNVITFPVKGLAVYDDDGAYYANPNGAFRLEIPAE